jgi:hypothetical protein
MLYCRHQEKAVQFLVFAEGVNFIGKRKSRRKNAEAAVDASEYVSLEVNREKNVSMSSYRNSGKI